MDFLGIRDLRYLELEPNSPAIRKLERYFLNRQINVKTTGGKTRVIRGLVPCATFEEFEKDGRTITVQVILSRSNTSSTSTNTFQDYLRSSFNITLKHPRCFGIRLTGRNAPRQAIVPAEICVVLPGQLYKKKLPSHLTSDVVRFSTLKPDDRRSRILNNAESPVSDQACP
jgi:eukaryotic translation initiation factor 2C